MHKPGVWRIVDFWRSDRLHVIWTIISILAGLFSLMAVCPIGGPELVKAGNLILGQVQSVEVVLTAIAAEGGTSGTPAWEQINWRLIFSLVFTAGVFIAFFWAFFVSLHTRDPNTIQTAKEYTKLFGGILIGAAQTTLGFGK